MGNLKYITLGIFLAFAGVIFILLGLGVNILISNNGILIQEQWSKIIILIIGFLFILIAIYLEIKRKPVKSLNKSSRESEAKSLEKANQKIDAKDFFATLDDKTSDSFPDMVKNAVSVKIVGRTGVNLLSHYGKVFEEIINDGCSVKVLFIDPNSDAYKFLFGDNFNVFKSNIIASAQHLKLLKSSCKNMLEVRITKHAPTLSIIIIEKRVPSESFIQVQLYFLHSAIGRDRPIFRINSGDKWQKVFLDEFNKQWSNSVEWDVSQFLENNLK